MNVTIKNKLNGLIESLECPQDSIPHQDSRLQLGFVLDAGPSNITQLPSYGLAVPECNIMLCRFTRVDCRGSL